MSESSRESRPLMRVDDLAVSFDNGKLPRIQAVAGVRMSIFEGQTLAVVGESGCGKSVTALSSLQLIPRPPGRFDSGRVLFRPDPALGLGDEADLLRLDAGDMRKIRGNEIAMIFQEPMTSLNPVFTVGHQIAEAVRLHQGGSEHHAKRVCIEAMREVGIPEPERRFNAYPHQFSGGMRQRVMIAMALACKPKLLLADEPTTALDVTIQDQILSLLGTLKARFGTAVMLITHDLGVVAQNADVVCVMYAGRVVEYATVFEVFERPLHPYTRGLLASIPRLSQRTDRLTTIAEVISDRSQFESLPGVKAAYRPWWPWHDPPASSDGYALAEVSGAHWVGLWKTPEVKPEMCPFPEVRFERSPSRQTG